MAHSETSTTTGTDSAASRTENTPLQTAVVRGAGSRGFTLIELLVVLAIVGILASIGWNSFNAVRETAREARASAEIRGLEKDITGYFLDRGTYPADYAALIAYLNRGDRLDPWGHPYQYKPFVSLGMKYNGVNDLNADYDLYSKGKDGLSPDLSINDPNSKDDIIRSGNGTYVGTVKLYLN